MPRWILMIALALPIFAQAEEGGLMPVLENVEKTVREGMEKGLEPNKETSPDGDEEGVELKGNEEGEGDPERPTGREFVVKVPLGCVQQSIKTRYTGKSYASCKAGGGAPSFEGPSPLTATKAYARWVHKHLHQAAACFGADPAVLFALWSGESGFQVNLKNTTGSAATGFSQFLVGTPTSQDFVYAVAKFQYGKGKALTPDEMPWFGEEAREKMKSDPACKEYLTLAYWSAERVAHESLKDYCAQAKDLVNTEPASLERSVKLNTVVGVINHLRTLDYAKRSLGSLDDYLRRNVGIAADREKITQAVKMQGGWGQGGIARAVQAVQSAKIRSFDDFDRKLGASRDFDLYARTKKQTFQERLNDGPLGGEELQKCAPFVKKP